MPVPPRGETARRKIVTVMFADVVGSTALGERTEPEVLQRMMTAHAVLAREIIESNGGLVEKFIGDAVMAVFGLPTAREDDALRAVRVAVELRARTRLPLRIGVNSGEVLVAPATVGLGMLSADALNTAARLEQLAAPEEILVGELTYRLVRDHVRAEALDGLQARGKQASLTAYRLIGVGAPSEDSRAAHWRVVGRDDELSRLRAFLDSASDEPGCELQCVVGLPGIGKTRLVDELIGSIPSESLLYGRCLPYGQPSAFWPIAQAVRARAGVTDDSSTEFALHQLRRLVASVREPEQFVQTVAASLGMGSMLDRFEDGFWALRQLLEHLARLAPVVLVLDDLQWADAELLDFIDYLVERFSGESLRVLALARPELLSRRPAWSGDALKLEPLPNGALTELVSQILGHDDVPPIVLEYIVSASGGSPLFARELSRMLVEDGVLWRSGTSWVVDHGRLAVAVPPPTISAVLSARLDQLDPAARRVLAAASVVGESFGRRAVSAMVEPGTAVAHHLHQLIVNEFVRPDAAEFTGDDGYRFGHLLVRDAVYASIPKSERAGLHESFADWLSKVIADRQTEFDAIIAHHYDQTHRYLTELGEAERGSPSARRAAAWLSQVGQRAWRLNDAASAAERFARAVSLLPPADPAVFGWFYECLDALGNSGDFVLARSLLDEAESASDADDMMAQAWLELARVGYWTGAASEDVQAWACAARESALAAYGAFERIGERRGQLFASTALAHAAGQLCHLGEASVAFRDAARLARELGDDAVAYRLEGSALWSAADGPASLDDVSAGLVALGPPPVGRRELAKTVDGLLAEVDSLAGRQAEASASFAKAAMARVEGGDTLGRGYTAVNAATAALRAGNPDEARTLLEVVDDDLARIGERGIRSSVTALLARALAASNQPEDALRLADTAETLAASDLLTAIHAERACAAAFSALGQFEAAEAAARKAHKAVCQTDMVVDHAEVLLELADILRLQERPADALAFITEARTLAGAKKSAWLDAQVAAANARMP